MGSVLIGSRVPPALEPSAGPTSLQKRRDKMQKKPGRRTRRPAVTEKGREDQLISLAVDLAEKQMVEGTASSQFDIVLLPSRCDQTRRSAKSNCPVRRQDP